MAVVVPGKRKRKVKGKGDRESCVCGSGRPKGGSEACVRRLRKKKIEREEFGAVFGSVFYFWQRERGGPLSCLSDREDGEAARRYVGRLVSVRKIQTSRGERGGRLDRFRVRLFPLYFYFFLSFFFQNCPPLCKC